MDALDHVLCFLVLFPLGLPRYPACSHLLVRHHFPPTAVYLRSHAGHADGRPTGCVLTAENAEISGVTTLCKGGQVVTEALAG
jgi:hypothetical protein